VRIRDPRTAIRYGIGYATEDRRALGLILRMSVSANVTLPALSQYLDRLGFLRGGAEARTAAEFRDRLRIRTQSIRAPVGSLSGGNQQKVMLSKWLNTTPRVLILDEPTRGIDVGAKADVHQMIDDLARSGMAIVMISSDLPEVLHMSDRILVMREGRQMAVIDRAQATAESVLAAAMGLPEPTAA
jgi:rhamnose transport system ATP-binding protein